MVVLKWLQGYPEEIGSGRQFVRETAVIYFLFDIKNANINYQG